MAGNRKAVEAYIIAGIKRIHPSDTVNVQIYQDMFAQMSNADFDKWMQDIKAKRQYLFYNLPNFGVDGAGKEINIDTQHLIKCCEDIGVAVFEQLVIPAQDGRPAYVTPQKYPILLTVARRQSQLWAKKVSVPKVTKIIDSSTGQPVGASKGGSTSYPEIGILAATGLDNTVNEIVNFRGGDVRGYQAMIAMVEKNGTVSQEVAAQFSGKIKSASTLSMYLRGMHLQNNI